jgi:CTP:molybdopterin cytidylyltransferase MocA
MGGPKAFTALGGVTFLERILARAREAGCPVLLAVDPAFRVRVETLLATLPPVQARLLEADGTRPMLETVQAGVRGLDGAARGAWVWPVDAPLLSADGWRKVRANVHEDPDHIVKLRTEGRTGHPTWFPRWAISDIRAGHWENGLLGFLKGMRPERVRLLDLPGEVLNDFNTPEELAAVKT